MWCIMISDQTLANSVPNCSTDRSFIGVVRSVCGPLLITEKFEKVLHVSETCNTFFFFFFLVNRRRKKQTN